MTTQLGLPRQAAQWWDISLAMTRRSVHIPTHWDLIGAGITLIGMAIIMFGPRPA
jgi:drug/metabolite transporter superfamily protein YnfA